MSIKIHESCKEKEFGGDDKKSLNKTALSNSDTPKMDTVFANSNCEDLISSFIQRVPSYEGYDGRQSLVPKFMERVSHENLERFYICTENESKLNGGRNICFEEQPLDFSRKPISKVNKDMFPQKFKKLILNTTITSQKNQERNANNSECDDDSFDDEEKPEHFRLNANRTKVSRVIFHRNGHENTLVEKKEVKLHKMSNRISAQCPRRNEYKRNGLGAENSSGSDDEFHPKYSVHESRNLKPNDDHFQIKLSYNAHLSAERKKSPHSQHTISEMPYVSNHHLANGSRISTERNDRFHIQDILNRDNQSAPEEDSKTMHQIKNFKTQLGTSPLSTSSHFVKEENRPSKSISPGDTANILSGPTSPSHVVNFRGSTNPSHAINIPVSTSPINVVNLPPGSISPCHAVNLPSGDTSPNHAASPPESISPSYNMKFHSGYNSSSHSMHLPASIYPFKVTDRLHESNGMITPYMQTVLPPNNIAHFMNPNSLEVSNYSRLFSYPPGPMLQPSFNPMYAQSYQQAQLVGEDQQKQKKQRPFKNIDPSILIQHLPKIQTEKALNLDPTPSQNINHTECSKSTAVDSSPQRHSPDSPCIVNGSSSNDSLPQDTNDESGRKKVRRIPPEEKDEKYLEKRRKNNLAAKKSRDERRKKEDLLALSCNRLVEENIKLKTTNNMMFQTYKSQEQKLDSLIGNLISFREKCDGRTKEMFEDTFRLFLPQL